MARILVVDDMAVIREPIAMALEQAGHDAVCAANGREALDMLSGDLPDAIVLDIHMPKVDGFEVLGFLRRDPRLRDIPVMLLTESSGRDVVLRARDLGVRQFLSKSAFTLDEMLTRVTTLISAAPAAAAVAAAPGQSNVPASGDVAPASPGTAGAPEADAGSAEDTPALTPGDPAESLQQLKPVMTRTQVMEKLEACGEMRALSPTVTELLKITAREEATVEQIAKVIKRDQAIALKILKLANTSLYTRGEPVDSIKDAIVRIGISSIRDAVLNMSVVDQFDSVHLDEGIDPLQFWEHSIGCGIIAMRIAEARGAKEPDQAFTMGLLHDIGRVVYTEQFAELYGLVLKTAHDLQLPVERVEVRMLLLSHADAMDRILHAWKFPKDLVDPIVFHHMSLGNIRRMTPKRVDDVSTLALANRLTHALMLGSSGNETLYPTEEFCHYLKIDAAIVHDIEETASEAAEDVKLVMLAAAQPTNWVERRDVHRSSLPADFRPLYISAEPGLDAFRIFCSRLSDSTDEPPNVGVVHLKETRESIAVSKLYAEAEAESGAGTLPLIVLSPNGKNRLSRAVMANRHVQLVHTPVTIARFSEAICNAVSGTDCRVAA